LNNGPPTRRLYEIYIYICVLYDYIRYIGTYRQCCTMIVLDRREKLVTQQSPPPPPPRVNTLGKRERNEHRLYIYILYISILVICTSVCVLCVWVPVEYIYSDNNIKVIYYYYFVSFFFLRIYSLKIFDVICIIIHTIDIFWLNNWKPTITRVYYKCIENERPPARKRKPPAPERRKKTWKSTECTY